MTRVRRSEYCCSADGQRLQILRASNWAEMGYIEFPREGYTVRAPDGEFIAVVHSIQDGLSAMLDYWDRCTREQPAVYPWPLLN